jgi:hypothetical protein
MNKLITLITILSFALTSCNSVKAQRNQTVIISSHPEGAQIVIDGFDCGTTPTTVGLNPKYQHAITLEKEGYYPETYILKSKVSGKKLSNNLSFPIAGLAVGAVTAAVALSGGIGGGSALAGICLVVVGLGAAVGLAAGTTAGLLGTGVDVCTGKARSFTTNEVHLDLQPAQ